MLLYILYLFFWLKCCFFLNHEVNGLNCHFWSNNNSRIFRVSLNPQTHRLGKNFRGSYCWYDRKNWIINKIWKPNPTWETQPWTWSYQLSPLFGILWLHSFKTYLLIELKFYRISRGLSYANSHSIYNIWTVNGCNCRFYSDKVEKSHTKQHPYKLNVLTSLHGKLNSVPLFLTCNFNWRFSLLEETILPFLLAF